MGTTMSLSFAPEPAAAAADAGADALAPGAAFSLLACAVATFRPIASASAAAPSLPLAITWTVNLPTARLYMKVSTASKKHLLHLVALSPRLATVAPLG